MKRIYGNWKMSWVTVILFAVITGVYTGLVMTVPFLKDTSFQDIGIGFEWWVIFAVLVVVNCKKGWEATLKCFAFFLISQPLVYLVQILLGCLSWELGLYYYRAIWLPMTFLTLPGGFIAYFCKKQNALGGIVLGLGNTIQAIMALSYFGSAIKQFPHHLISGIVSFVSILIMSFYIQEKRKNQLIAIMLPILLTAAICVWAKMNGRILF